MIIINVFCVEIVIFLERYCNSIWLLGWCNRVLLGRYGFVAVLGDCI